MWSSKLVEINFSNNTKNAFFTNLSIEIIGSILGSVVAIGLFVWQLNNEASEKRKVEKQKEIEILNYVKYLIFQGSEWISSQITLINEYCKLLNSEPHTIPRSEFDPDKTFERLYKIFSNKGFHHTYNNTFSQTEKSLKDYKNIEDCIDYFSSLYAQLVNARKEAIDKYYNRIFRLQDMLADEFDRLARIMSKYERTKDDNFSKMLFEQLSIIKKLDSIDINGHVQQFKIIRQNVLSHFGKMAESQDIVYRVDRILNLKTEITENINFHKNDIEIVLGFIIKMGEKYTACTQGLRELKI